VNNFIFLSDFDGTISVKDFYLKFAKGPLLELDTFCLDEIKAGRMSSFEYLNEILKNLNLNTSELEHEINSLEIDPFVKPLISKVRSSNGEFVVLSAGSSAYITPILEKLSSMKIELYSNGGTITDSGIEMHYPTDKNLYHKFYGINKIVVALKFRDKFKKMIYAGDGSSDFEAAKLCDIRFAKRSLARRLTEANIPFIPFDDFNDIENYLNLNFF
jgi:2-hydroxy-3-keto-5-methylthiopentenyl-1-phosphate phosphatase